MSAESFSIWGDSSDGIYSMGSVDEWSEDSAPRARVHSNPARAHRYSLFYRSIMDSVARLMDAFFRQLRFDVWARKQAACTAKVLKRIRDAEFSRTEAAKRSNLRRNFR